VTGFEGFSRQTLLGICQAQAELLVKYEQRIAEQDRMIAQQQQRLDEQAVQLTQLRDQVARLERRLSRHSGNSSLPPSTDGAIPGREVPAPPAKPPAARRRGGQRGATGKTLAWTPSPNEVLDHRPSGACGGCGADLAGAVPAGVVRAGQVTDVPLLIPTVTEHRVHAAVCGCGRRVVADTPAVIADDTPCVYGPNLRALAVYLMVVHAVPVGRVVDICSDVAGTSVSPGFAHGLLKSTAARLAEPEQRIRTAIEGSLVVGFDETPLKVGARGESWYAWVAVTDRYTLFHLAARTLTAFVAWGIGQHLAGTVIHDNYSVYDNPKAIWDKALHQLCVAHLLRHLADAAADHPTMTWPGLLADALRALVAAHHHARDAGLPAIPDAIAGPLLADFDTALATGRTALPHQPTRKQPPARNLLDLLHTRRGDVLRFTADTQVPPTNNTSERAVRPLKTQQKISGRLTSPTATRHRLTIRGYLATAVQHGRNTMTTLRDVYLAHTWLPPLPAGP
jgi:uncharacterized coiled-coil protein SlyX